MIHKMPTFYSVDTKTKEHMFTGNYMPVFAEHCKIVEADPDGWIKHEGGECPLPLHCPCECKSKDGDSMKFSAAGSVIGWSKAVAYYRPILEDKEQDMSEQEWDGKGLPLEGAHCEYWTDADWDQCEILAYRGGKVVFWHPRRQRAYQGPVDEYHFRPIRTAAQRAEDAVSASLRMQLMQSPIDPDAAASALYRAIRDGRIPGVKLEGES